MSLTLKLMTLISYPPVIISKSDYQDVLPWRACLESAGGVLSAPTFINPNIKSCILLVIGSVGAAYTHYFAFVSICFINAILFVFLLFNNRKTLKRYFICLLVMLLLYSPWMPYMYKQVTAVRAGYWIAPITLETIWSYFVWTFGLNLLPGFEYLYIALIGSLIVLSFIYIKNNNLNQKNVYP